MAATNREIAEAFVEARRTGQAIAAYPGELPATLADAYRIQDAALGLWDRPIGGWKVGKIGAPSDGELGSDRLAGPVFADAIVELGDDPLAMPVFSQGFAAVEAEFMLRLAPRPGSPYPATNAEAIEWVDAIRIGIEIASSPYPFINRDGPCVTISDHGNNLGLVLGREVPRERWDALDEIEVTLGIDGKTVGAATTATMLDGPFGAVRFLLENLHSRAIAPRAGWWVSSGAITGVHEVSPGARIVAGFGGLGTVPAEIVALD